MSFKRWNVPVYVPILVGVVAAILYIVLERNVLTRTGNNVLASLIVIAVLFILVWLMRGSAEGEG